MDLNSTPKKQARFLFCSGWSREVWGRLLEHFGRMSGEGLGEMFGRFFGAHLEGFRADCYMEKPMKDLCKNQYKPEKPRNPCQDPSYLLGEW